jgi:hypothetical protein
MKIKYLVNMAGSSVINIGDVADLPTEAAKRLIDKGFAVKIVEKAQVKKAVISKSTTKSKKK